MGTATDRHRCPRLGGSMDRGPVEQVPAQSAQRDGAVRGADHVLRASCPSRRRSASSSSRSTTASMTSASVSASRAGNPGAKPALGGRGDHLGQAVGGAGQDLGLDAAGVDQRDHAEAHLGDDVAQVLEVGAQGPAVVAAQRPGGLVGLGSGQHQGGAGSPSQRGRATGGPADRWPRRWAGYDELAEEEQIVGGVAPGHSRGLGGGVGHPREPQRLGVAPARPRCRSRRSGRASRSNRAEVPARAPKNTAPGRPADDGGPVAVAVGEASRRSRGPGGRDWPTRAG